MFEINEVYRSSIPMEDVPRLLRLVAHNGDQVVLMSLIEGIDNKTGPVWIDYFRWIDMTAEGHLEKTTDPFEWMPSTVPSNLPPGTRERIKSFQQIVAAFSRNEQVIFRPRALSEFLHEQARLLHELALQDPSVSAPSKDTIKRWFFSWLRAGKKPMGIAQSFLLDKPPKLQTKGKRRGVPNAALPAESLIPSYEAENLYEKAYARFILNSKYSLDDAYAASLKYLCKIPVKDLKVIFTDMQVAKKYKFFTKEQFRRAIRRFEDRDRPAIDGIPAGKRGRATDGVYGPGYFEIDATHIQIQLVSRIGGRNLVSRPTVYFVVDVFSGVIVGYVLTLENPSWAVAMLALHNSFSDKGPTFSRLALPYRTEDWPCHHLPVMLRADRAELVTNRGQNFPQSLVRLEVAPPYAAVAKGTVEGKNSEVKRKVKILPGSYKKRLERNDSNGKAAAVYDLDQFERRLVEVIMELNLRPLRRSRIPIESIRAGEIVGSRLDLWKWGLKHRAGFTVKPPANFFYEHLLAHGQATLTSRGIQFESQTYRCDLLLKLGWLQNAPLSGRPIEIAYNLLYAGEVFFKSTDGTWHPATNLDTDVISSKASFAELKELRLLLNNVLLQAGTTAFLAKDARAADMRENAAIAREQTREMRAIGGVSKRALRESRNADKRLSRGPVKSPGEQRASNEQPHTQANLVKQTSTPGSKPPRKAIDFWDEE